MYIECHFDARTGDILAVWEAGHQPFENPADAWRPFSTPLEPTTGEPLTAEDGTLDAARLPQNYGVAKIDLDYATQVAIEQGAYDARIPRSQWIKDHMRIDTARVGAPPAGARAGGMKTARLVAKA